MGNSVIYSCDGQGTILEHTYYDVFGKKGTPGDCSGPKLYTLSINRGCSEFAIGDVYYTWSGYCQAHTKPAPAGEQPPYASYFSTWHACTHAHTLDYFQTLTTYAAIVTRTWSEVGSKIACDASAGEVYMEDLSAPAQSLQQCKTLCENTSGCQSITLFVSGWCGLFSTRCTKTKQTKQGLAMRFITVSQEHTIVTGTCLQIMCWSQSGQRVSVRVPMLRYWHDPPYRVRVPISVPKRWQFILQIMHVYAACFRSEKLHM